MNIVHLPGVLQVVSLIKINRTGRHRISQLFLSFLLSPRIASLHRPTSCKCEIFDPYSEIKIIRHPILDRHEMTFVEIFLLVFPLYPGRIGL